MSKYHIVWNLNLYRGSNYNYSKIDQGKLKVTIRTNDDVHVSWKSVHWFRRRFLKEFLSNMGVTAVLVKWHRCHDYALCYPTHGGTTRNSALIGQAVAEKIFDIGQHTTFAISKDTISKGILLSQRVSLTAHVSLTVNHNK